MSDGNYTPDYVFVFEPTLRAGAVQGVPAPLADGQASEITDLGAIPGTEGTTERPDLIPAAQVEPTDVGALSLRYVGGVPQLVVSGGRAIPAVLAVVDESGVPVASYAAGAAPERTRSALLAAAAIGGLTLTTEVSIADAPVEGSAVEGMGGLGQTM